MTSIDSDALNDPKSRHSHEHMTAVDGLKSREHAPRYTSPCANPPIHIPWWRANPCSTSRILSQVSGGVRNRSRKYAPAVTTAKRKSYNDQSTLEVRIPIQSRKRTLEYGDADPMGYLLKRAGNARGSVVTRAKMSPSQIDDMRQDNTSHKRTRERNAEMFTHRYNCQRCRTCWSDDLPNEKKRSVSIRDTHRHIGNVAHCLEEQERRLVG